jgi:hypothetical protein
LSLLLHRPLFSVVQSRVVQGVLQHGLALWVVSSAQSRYYSSTLYDVSVRNLLNDVPIFKASIFGCAAFYLHSICDLSMQLFRLELLQVVVPAMMRSSLSEIQSKYTHQAYTSSGKSSN